MSTGPVELQGITINAGILETLQGFSTQRNVLKGITIAVGTGASIMQLKVVDRNHEPIEGATCRVLNAIGGSNNVLSKDGTDDYTSMGNVLQMETSNITMMLWLYPQKVHGDYFGIIGKPHWGSLAGRYSMHWRTNNRVGFIMQHTAVLEIVSTTQIQQNQWTHLAVVVDRLNNVKLYINGNLEVTSANVNTSAYNMSAAKNFTLGSYDGGNRFFQGKMSDARFYYAALSQQEILDTMDTRLNGDEAGIESYWKLDEGTGTTATDSAGSNNGTIYGATWAEADESFPLFDDSIQGYDPTPYDSQTTNANGLTTLNYQINALHGLEVTLPGKRRFIMPFERTTRGLLDWQVMLSDYLATFATDRGNILINSEPENNDSNFLIE